MIPERENQYIEFKEESGLFHYDTVEVAAAQKSQLNFSDIADYFTRYELAFADESEEERERLLRASDQL